MYIVFRVFPCLYKPKEINIETILDINKKEINGWKHYIIGISTRPATHSVHTFLLFKKVQFKTKRFF